MKKIKCAHVEDLLFDYVSGDLGDAEHAAVKVHLAICDNCREMAELCEGLPRAVGNSEMPPMDEASLKMATHPQTREESHSHSTPGSRRWVLAAGISAVAASAILVITLGLRSTEDDGEKTITPIADDLIEWPADGPLAVSPGINLWLSRGGVARVKQLDDQFIRLEIKAGTIISEIGPQAPGFQFVVESPRGESTARGTVFSVTVGEDGGETVRVCEGVVEVAENSSSAGTVEVLAGQQLSIGARGPVVATTEDLASDLSHLEFGTEGDTSAKSGFAGPPTEDAAGESAPDRLLKLARTYRSSRNYAAASRVYLSLIDGYPADERAINALVSLGQMEMMFMAEPELAAKHLRKYLDLMPRGPLAHEASSMLDRMGPETPAP